MRYRSSPRQPLPAANRWPSLSAVWPWAFACALVASSAVQAQAAPAGYQIVGDTCQPQKPRFPARYAHFRALRGAAAVDRLHLVALATKDAEAHLDVEAQIQEIDLNGDGICDQIVFVSDPIGTGGDHYVLATIYIARKGRWQRIGARSAAKSDSPADLYTMTPPKDEQFVFGTAEALRRPGGARTFLVVWTADQRVSNGYNGYRILEVNQAVGSLVAVDKWNGEAAGSRVDSGDRYARLLAANGQWTRCAVRDLRGIVEDAVRGCPVDDGLQRELCNLGSRNQLVEVVDIRLMMLAEVVLHGLKRDVRRQTVLRTRQLGQFVFRDAVVFLDPTSEAKWARPSSAFLCAGAPLVCRCQTWRLQPLVPSVE